MLKIKAENGGDLNWATRKAIRGFSWATAKVLDPDLRPAGVSVSSDLVLKLISYVSIGAAIWNRTAFGMIEENSLEHADREYVK